uniref:Delta-actitoxin-Amc3a n=1 Tax=Antheopsis maculata TaxID=280228 RepID=NA13_ANTMC|nr:RecName: Full=Delta-actitoxin-Amc3a; Short=Delta-AITX-Amc3a; AltName: Full=Peptide toxin Am III; AltName: Full=Peptide toxin Am-3; Flags: Precursor [Antheopsis maculata]BAD74023.1 peptide toxin [Antheopsis maculata]
MNRLIILVVAAVFLGMASAEEDVLKRGFPCRCDSDGPSVHGNPLSGTIWVTSCATGWHKCNSENELFHECCKQG